MKRLEEISETWGCVLGLVCGAMLLLFVFFMFGLLLWIAFD